VTAGGKDWGGFGWGPGGDDGGVGIAEGVLLGAGAEAAQDGGDEEGQDEGSSSRRDFDTTHELKANPVETAAETTTVILS